MAETKTRVRVNVYLQDKVHKKAKKLAEKKGISFSELVNELLKGYKHGTTKSKKSK